MLAELGDNRGFGPWAQGKGNKCDDSHAEISSSNLSIKLDLQML